jgi:hypothetical protein
VIQNNFFFVKELYRHINHAVAIAQVKNLARKAHRPWPQTELGTWLSKLGLEVVKSSWLSFRLKFRVRPWVGEPEKFSIESKRKQLIPNLHSDLTLKIQSGDSDVEITSTGMVLPAEVRRPVK